MSRLVAWLDERWYPDYVRNWDDLILRDRILRYLTSESVVLDVGAGAGIVDAMDFRGHAARICGVDLDPRVVTNPFLSEGRVSDVTRLPYEDSMFDVAFADNVMEHLETPVDVLREAFRVLKPGGVFLFKTPNRNHYMPLVARMTPHRFHQYVNKLRGRSEADTFPTRYRANSARQVRRLARLTGFEVTRIDRIEGRPEYLRMSGFTYLLGALYERAVNLSARLAGLRVVLIAELRKPKLAPG